MTSSADMVYERLKNVASELGFDQLGIAPAVSPAGFHPLLDWLGNGYAADMNWIERRRDAYEHPDGVMPNTRSVIVAAMNYHNRDPLPGTARIARYAWSGQDYHDLLRDRLKQLSGELHELCPDAKTRVAVDTAPLLERDFARLSGIGWFGKNTMLISREIGSWFFLGAILTTAELEYDTPFEAEFCGSCTRCLDACPTNAFPEPHVLDANRCISYHTIENRDREIPDDLAADFGDWVFGCDICQEVCPWNRFAPKDSDPALHPRVDLHGLTVEQILDLSGTDFSKQFHGTPLQRTGLEALKRNARIVAANQQEH